MNDLRKANLEDVLGGLVGALVQKAVTDWNGCPNHIVVGDSKRDGSKLTIEVTKLDMNRARELAGVS